MLAQAATFPLPGDGKRLVGETSFVIAQKEDTLLDIARQYSLGFNEITAANPGIDPWLPKEGARVVLPTQFILPDAPWQGIVVNLAEMRLYYFPEQVNGQPRQVVTYPIGIGRQGWETPTGNYLITQKLENPSWTMPNSVYDEAIANGNKPSRLIQPGPDNPLGKFAMQLDADSLLIHGTNMPFSIGMRVSRGCLRLYPEDIRSLIGMVPKGTMVSIVEQPYKVSYESGTLFLEAHEPVGFNRTQTGLDLTPVIRGVVASGIGDIPDTQWENIVTLAGEHSGVPVAVESTKPGRPGPRAAVSLPYPFP
ncbi:L,D-transpeptidase family protein [Kaarinaea lacus]